MIAKLSGLLDSVSLDHLILDVNGVGYLVFGSRSTLSKLPEKGGTVSLYIETQIREDAFNLYGFADKAEQEWFKLLISVQGVGAKAALAILSAVPVDQLGFAIASQDKAAITQADGVGPKLATRIVTELKDKVDKIEISAEDFAASGTKMDAQAVGAADASGGSSIDNDAVSALVNLGYGRTDAFAAVRQAREKSNDNQPEDVGTLIRLALKELASS